MKKAKKKAKSKRVGPGPSPPPTPVAHWRLPPPGRRSTFAQDVADRICVRMSSGETLNQICRDEDMPASPTVRAWRVQYPLFDKQYNIAYDALCEHWAEDVVTISDDSENDYVNREVRSGRMVRSLDPEHVARAKLRVDSRKWLLSKLKRDKYGEHVQQEVTGKDGAPLALPVLNVIIDGGAVANVSSSSTTDAGSGPAAPSETGLGIPVKRD